MSPLVDAVACHLLWHLRYTAELEQARVRINAMLADLDKQRFTDLMRRVYGDPET